MPIQPDQRFVRQSVSLSEKVGLVIPWNAKMIPGLRETLVKRLGTAGLPPPTEPPHAFSFHYIDSPLDDSMLDDGATINNGIYEFLVRDAVIGVFDLPAFQDDEFCWSFSSTSQINVLAAVKIGETIDVAFDHEFDQVFHLTKYHFPSGVPDSGYGEYPVHLAIDGLNPKGFRIVSSYEPQAKRTQSRLPFFFGFRIFGKAKGDPEYPVWRELLTDSVRQALLRRWQHALLYAAFSLESFIDQRLSAKLEASAVGEIYAEHILRVGERRHELHALNNREVGLSEKQVNRVYDTLNKIIFTPRNRLAHGKVMGNEITSDMAVEAIKAAVEFIWDWSKEARPWLLPKMRPFRFEDLIDEDLLRACNSDA